MNVHKKKLRTFLLDFSLFFNQKIIYIFATEKIKKNILFFIQLIIIFLDLVLLFV